MSLNFWDDQAEKIKATPQQTKASLPISDQLEASKKAKKEKKKKWQQKEQARKDFKEDSPVPTAITILTNYIVQAKSRQKKKKCQDASKVTCYSCSKKDYYVKDYTKIKI